MIHIFRRNQRVLMLVVAILTIIAFIWLYNPDTTGQAGPSAVAEIYGRSLTQADIDRQVRIYGLAMTMGQLDLISSLGGTAENEDMALSEFVWNRLVLEHEAHELGVAPAASQIAGRIMSLPIFLTDGQFDPRKYAAFSERQLAPKGFSEDQLDKVMGDVLRLERIRDIVGAPVAVSKAEIAEASRYLQKVDIELVRFPLADALPGMAVTDEEVQEFFTRAKLNAPETRTVEFVEFAAVPGETPAEGTSRIEAMQKLADVASAFADKAATSTFESAAAAAGLDIQKSPAFDRSGTLVKGVKAASPEQAEDWRKLAPAAFLLTEARPVSDVLQSGKRFFVIKLAGVNPEHPLTIEEVRPMLEARIKAGKAQRLIRENAAAALPKIREAMAGGKSFADAATAAGFVPETIDGLDFTAETLTPEQQVAAGATLLMELGQVSGFLPAPKGGIAVYLAARAPLADAARARQESEIKPALLKNKRQLLFLSWLHAAREGAGVAVNKRAH